MENNCEPSFINDTLARVNSHFKFVTELRFNTTLFITISIFNYLLPVTRNLQTKKSDIAQSIDLIKVFELTIEKLRNKSDYQGVN